MAKKISADFVELHTGRYAQSKERRAQSEELKKIIDVSKYVLQLGLGLNAGHGLDYENVRGIAKIKGMNELNIGYSIICRAVFVGLFQAVKEMMGIIKSAE